MFAVVHFEEERMCLNGAVLDIYLSGDDSIDFDLFAKKVKDLKELRIDPEDGDLNLRCEEMSWSERISYAVDMLILEEPNLYKSVEVLEPVHIEMVVS